MVFASKMIMDSFNTLTPVALPEISFEFALTANVNSPNPNVNSLTGRTNFRTASEALDETLNTPNMMETNFSFASTVLEINQESVSFSGMKFS